MSLTKVSRTTKKRAVPDPVPEVEAETPAPVSEAEAETPVTGDDTTAMDEGGAPAVHGADPVAAYAVAPPTEGGSTDGTPANMEAQAEALPIEEDPGNDPLIADEVPPPLEEVPPPQDQAATALPVEQAMPAPAPEATAGNEVEADPAPAEGGPPPEAAAPTVTADVTKAVTPAPAQAPAPDMANPPQKGAAGVEDAHVQPPASVGPVVPIVLPAIEVVGSRAHSVLQAARCASTETARLVAVAPVATIDLAALSSTAANSGQLDTKVKVSHAEYATARGKSKKQYRQLEQAGALIVDDAPGCLISEGQLDLIGLVAGAKDAPLATGSTGDLATTFAQLGRSVT